MELQLRHVQGAWLVTGVTTRDEMSIPLWLDWWTRDDVGKNNLYFDYLIILKQLSVSPKNTGWRANVLFKKLKWQNSWWDLKRMNEAQQA